MNCGKHTAEEKEEWISKYAAGVKIADITKTFNICISTFYLALEKLQDTDMESYNNIMKNRKGLWKTNKNICERGITKRVIVKPRGIDFSTLNNKTTNSKLLDWAIANGINETIENLTIKAKAYGITILKK